MEYQYEVFLSWTGADRALKDDLKDFLRAEGFERVYDSDEGCLAGEFRIDYIEALERSQVYLMILTDSVLNNPTLSGSGFYSEVRKEGNYAMELESRGLLNILILNLSTQLRNAKRSTDFAAENGLAKHFYAMTKGFTQKLVDYTDGLLNDATKHYVLETITHFVTMRQAGTPVLSDSPLIKIARDPALKEDGLFVGREEDLADVLAQFDQGKQVVVLTGIGGIGKTCLATRFAQQCNQNHTYVCPQIVRIHDKNDKSAHETNYWIDIVRYTESFYNDGFGNLSPTDRHNKKRAAMLDLPEHVLLVIDNFNDISQKDIDDMVRSFHCKLLVTTRLRMTPNKMVACRDIKKLPPEDAYRMFCLRLEREDVTYDDFVHLYDYVHGHTITLCIVARLMARHNLNIDEVVDKVLDPNASRERVTFAHNDSEENNTVFGHLQSLFALSDISPEAQFVLKNLCLLNDGTIGRNTLLDTLDYTGVEGQAQGQSKADTRNALVELLDKGWLDKRAEEGDETIILHPAIGDMVAMELHPTIWETMAMQQSLIQESRTGNTAFRTVMSIQDRLFFALYRLAQSEGRLALALWQIFAENNHAIGDLTDTQNKVKQLSTALQDPNERDMVATFGELMTLERRPTDLDRLEKIVDDLDKNSAEYKWVLRILSVCIQYLVGKTQYYARLTNIVKKAFAVASAKNDDISAIYLFIYLTPIDYRAAISLLRPYLRRRKHEVGATGVVLFGQIQLHSAQLTKGYRDMRIQNTFANLNARISTDDSLAKKILGGLRFMLKLNLYGLMHPILNIRGYIMMFNLNRLPYKDRFHFLSETMGSWIGSLFDTSGLDVPSILKMVIELYRIRREEGITLTRLADEVQNVLNNMSREMSVGNMRKFARLIDRSTDYNSLSFEAMDNLHLAALVDTRCKNPQALAHYRRLLYCEEELHSRNHPDYIYLLIAYAQTCITFKQPAAAIAPLRLAYNLLRNTAPASGDMGTVCRLLLNMDKDLRNPKATQVLRNIITHALSCYKPDNINYYEALLHYCRCLQNKFFISADEVELAINAVEQGLPFLRKAHVNAQLLCADALWILFHAQQFLNTKSEKILSILKQLYAVSKSAAKKRAIIYYNYLCGNDFRQKNDNLKAQIYYQKAMRLCITYHREPHILAYAIANLLNTLPPKDLTFEKVFAVYLTDAKRCAILAAKYTDHFAPTHKALQELLVKCEISLDGITIRLKTKEGYIDIKPCDKDTLVYEEMRLVVKRDLRCLPKPFAKYRSINQLLYDYFVSITNDI